MKKINYTFDYLPFRLFGQLGPSGLKYKSALNTERTLLLLTSLSPIKLTSLK